MSLKRKSLIFSLALLPLACFHAFAATGDDMNAGKIHFTGRLVEASCVIDGDSGTDINVPLGTYLTSQFAATGDESEAMSFTIKLVGCPSTSDGLSSVQLTFNGDTSLTGSASLLNVSAISTTVDEKQVDDTPAATGVGIAISPEDQPDTLLKLDGSENQIYVATPEVSTDGVQTHFIARYKSFSDTVTAGPADADLTVNIMYR